MNEPIATYAEKAGRVKRRFELYPNRIRIRLHQRFGQRYDISVKLCSLDPVRDRIWIKDPVFETRAGLAFVVSLVSVFGLLSIALRQSMWLFWIPLAVVLVTFIALLFHNKRVEVARFVSIAGTHAFDIGQFGTTREEFEGFVRAVENQIDSAQKKSPNQASYATSEPAPGAVSSAHEG